MSRKLGVIRQREWRRAVIVGVVSILTSAILSDSAFAEALSDFVQIQSFKTHSRVSIKLDPTVTVDRLTNAKEGSQGFSILLRGIALTDLGAPFGAEPQWAKQLEAITEKDSRLARIEVLERADGVVVKATWKFPKGAAALADPRMETFHYRRDATTQYVVDFWLKPGPTLSAVRAAKERHDRDDRLASAQRRMQERRGRHLAAEKAREERNDNLRFCRESWDDQREVFLPFKPLETPFDFSKSFPTKSADKDYRYLQPKGDEEEAQLFRLAVKLHESGKYALALRTLEFLESRVKTVAIRVESEFLKANALMKLGYPEQGIQSLKSVIMQAQASQVAIRSAMYLALARHEAGDSLGALEHFLWLAQNHPKHELSWMFHLGAGMNLANLKQTQRAAEEFRWVVENAPAPEQQVQGAIRIGDLFLDRQQYEQALASYFLAVQQFPKLVGKFPSFSLNRAEALYWLGQYERSGQVMKEFIDSGAVSPSSWRATYRLAEIAGRSSDFKKANEWLLETVNRHPYSVGASLARMRIMSCDAALSTVGGPRSVEAFFKEELSQFNPTRDVLMDRFEDYRSLAHVRALLAVGSEEEAIDLALREIKGRSGAIPTSKAAMKGLLGHLFRKTILKKLGEKPNDETRLAALSYYQEMMERLPRGTNALDSDYLLKLSNAAVDLGMTVWGQQLAQAYQTALHADRTLASAEADEIDKKLVQSERAFTEARANWVSGESDSKIRPLLQKVEEESPYSYDRELLYSLLELRAGRPAAGLQAAQKALLLAPASEKSQLRLMHWIARLQAQAGNKLAAIGAYSQLRSELQKQAGKQQESSRLVALGIPALPPNASLALSETDLLVAEKRWGDAASILVSEFAKNAESDPKLGSPLKFRQAQVLAQTGNSQDLKKSRELLENLTKQAPEEFWKKMAQEALINSKPNAKEGNP